MKNFLNRWVLPVLSICVLLTLSACSDNPVEDDHGDDEHADAHGIQVLSGNDVVYRVLEGQVSCDTQPCGITVRLGEQSSSFIIEFLNEDGDEVHTEDLDEGFSLSVSVDTPAIATVQKVGDWSIMASAVSVGTTRIQLSLNHGGHADLTTPPLSSVNALTVSVVSP